MAAHGKGKASPSKISCPTRFMASVTMIKAAGSIRFGVSSHCQCKHNGILNSEHIAALSTSRCNVKMDRDMTPSKSIR